MAGVAGASYRKAAVLGELGVKEFFSFLMGFSGAMEKTWLQRGVAERERETRLAMHTKVCACATFDLCPG